MTDLAARLEAEAAEHERWEPSDSLIALLREAAAVVRLGASVAQAEKNYRMVHDSQGGGHITTGRAWDAMRRAGDAFREAAEAARGKA